MAEIRHRVGVEAPITDVYRAFTTADGVARWWTQTVDGNGKGEVGDVLAFRFGGEPAATVTIAELTPVKRVVWHVDQGPEDWVGTTIAFDLKSEDGMTIVVFTHGGWAEPVEFMHHCTTSWGYFLLSLKAAFERQAGTPWPTNTKIDNWSS